MENYYEILDCLASKLWESLLQRYCEIKINDKHQKVLTINLYYIQMDLYNIRFATFCSILKIYILSLKEDVIVQFDKSSMEGNKISYYNYYHRYYTLKDCDSEYITVFRFYFKNAVEVFYAKDEYDSTQE